MKYALIAAAMLITCPAFAGQGDTYSAGDRQVEQYAKWNGLYGREAFAWRTPNLSYSVGRSAAARGVNKKEIDATHRAKTGPQYPGGYANNGLNGKGKATHETGGPRGNVDHR